MQIIFSRKLLTNVFTNVTMQVKQCNELSQHLHPVLQGRESSDFQPYDSYEELQTMFPNLPNFIQHVKHQPPYITENELKEMYPNIYIVVQILLTISACTASAERRFSKLKVITFYLRNTMG